ncbi:MAG: hypothetical protein P8X39_04055, partial [Desulfofustis sp.]
MCFKREVHQNFALFSFMEMSELRLKCTDSTNREAMELGFRGAPHGSTVIAAQQDSGKGRLGRNWYSPAGRNLYCSFIVR